MNQKELIESLLTKVINATNESDKLNLGRDLIIFSLITNVVRACKTWSFSKEYLIREIQQELDTIYDYE